MDSLTFHRSTKSMISTPLHSGSLFPPSINWTQPNTHSHLDEISAPYHLHQSLSQAISTKSVYEVHFKKEKEEERISIIEHTYHRTINRTLHRDYHKLTPHRLSKCSQHRTSMSTCHRISKAHLDVSHILRITTVASPSSPHSSYCPTISH